MRRHDQANAWRRVASDEWDHPLKLEYVHLHKVPGFEDAHLKLSSGLALFCGVNASGKTRLLRLVKAGLDSLRDGPTVASLEISGSMTEAHYVDIFHLSQMQLRSIQLDQDLESRVEQAGMSPLRPKELRMLSWLVGRDYEQASIAELDADIDDDDVPASPTDRADNDVEGLFQDIVETLESVPQVEDDGKASAWEFRPEVIPYFTVTYNGQQYGSSEISRGELAAMNLIWVLKSIEPNSIVLFDEPDLFLSAEASARALTMIADYAHGRKSPMVVATHSPYGLAKAPDAYRVLLMRSVGGTSSLELGSDAKLWRALQVTAPINLVLAVEDEAGRQWAELFATYTDLADSWSFEVWNFTDASKVRIAAAMPEIKDATISFVGVLDGDERGRGKQNPNMIYLPTSQTPEEFILEKLRFEPRLTAALDREPQKIVSALSRYEGEDPHDRVAAIATDLGFAVNHLRGAVWQWWFSTPEGKAELQEWRDFFNSRKK
jgi:predicted ATPase